VSFLRPRPVVVSGGLLDDAHNVRTGQLDLWLLNPRPWSSSPC